MSVITLGDILDTSIAICNSGNGSLRNLLSIVVNSQDLELLRTQEIDNDRFLLVFSANSIDEPSEILPVIPGFTLILVNPYTPVSLGPLLALLASAVVLHESIYSLESQVLTAVNIAAARNIPVINIGDPFEDTPTPFIDCHITHRINTVDELTSVLRDLVPSSRFPFTIEAQPDNTWQFKPLAPFDFLTDAPLGTPRFHHVTGQVFRMVGRAKEKGRILPNTRYYACLVGDMCVSIEGEDGKRVATMIASR